MILIAHHISFEEFCAEVDVFIGSMFAVEVGADMVLACEKSRAMFEVAQDVITANDLDARIQLICASSTDLVVPEHIPER